MEQIKELLIELAALLIPLVGAIVVAYLRSIKDQLAKAYDVQLSAEQDRAVNDAIEIGVRRAEEKARQLTGGVHSLSGSDKQLIAIDSARRVGPRGLSQHDDDALKVLVDAAVQRLRPSMPPPPPK